MGAGPQAPVARFARTPQELITWEYCESNEFRNLDRLIEGGHRRALDVRMVVKPGTEVVKSGTEVVKSGTDIDS